jgi:diguanylate cyclase (GGDEF)-like protein/PAS domain S-box-containing protein
MTGVRSSLVGEAFTDDRALAEAIVASLPEGILVVDASGRVTKANEAAARLFGMALGELVGGHVTDLPVRAEREDPIGRGLAGETVRDVLVPVVRRDGTTLWAEVSARVLTEPDGRRYGVLSTWSEATERLRRERRMRQEADTDPLTGLPNRRALQRTLPAALERAARERREVGVLMLDLDGFKALNDRDGHAAGDQALCAVATALRGCVRERDLVARIGGDEFVIVLPDLHPGDSAASECAGRAGAALRERAGLSAAIGVACFPRHGVDDAALLAHADRAMYAAKR